MTEQQQRHGGEREAEMDRRPEQVQDSSVSPTAVAVERAAAAVGTRCGLYTPPPFHSLVLVCYVCDARGKRGKVIGEKTRDQGGRETEVDDETGKDEGVMVR